MRSQQSRSLIRKQMEEEEKEEEWEEKRGRRRRRRRETEEEEEIFIPLNLTKVEVNQYLNNMKTLKNVDVYYELDVSNRNLTNVSVIPRYFEFLRRVDVSGNRLTSEALQVLERMNLIELRADKNLLINAKLKPMNLLETLTMNNNKLTRIDTDDISHKQLKTLELEENLISTVKFEKEKLPELLILKLSGNALTTIEGICSSTLTNLFLDKNKIKEITNFKELPNLTKLNLQSNQLANLNGFTNQDLKLKYINLGDNIISNISEFVKLSCLSCLEKLIIRGNPCLEKIREYEGKKEVKEEKEEEEEVKEEKEEVKRYRCIILMMLPNLTSIDEIDVNEQEQEQAKELLVETQEKEFSFKDYDKKNFYF